MLLKNCYQKIIDLVSNKSFNLNFYVHDKSDCIVMYYQTYNKYLYDLKIIDIVIDYEMKDIIFNLKKE